MRCSFFWHAAAARHEASWSDPYISNIALIGIILLVTLVVIALRFFWIAAMLRVARDTITGQRRKMTPERWRSAAVMTLWRPQGNHHAVIDVYPSVLHCRRCAVPDA